MEEELNPVKVKVKLKNEMKTKDTTKWLCTINGERRIVTSQVVVWYCTSLEQAAKSFERKEIQYFVIDGLGT